MSQAQCLAVHAGAAQVEATADEQSLSTFLVVASTVLS